MEKLYVFVQKLGWCFDGTQMWFARVQIVLHESMESFVLFMEDVKIVLQFENLKMISLLRI